MEAGGGFVEGLVAAVAFFVDGGDLRLLEVANGFSADEVEAGGLEAEVEGKGVGSGGIFDFRFWIFDLELRAPGIDAADDLGDAALGESVVLGEL